MNEIREILPADFPLLLKEIPKVPFKLFIRGQLPSKNLNKTKFLCVVGSRQTSQYGADACRELIRGLRGYDIVVVSGLAIGIDAIAHKTAVDTGLKTIAVLGSGLSWDTIYPRQNLGLAKEILAAGGALISENNTQHKPYPYNFPERNRIMAGLSHATLVVEAAMKSGTLITARLALDYNRDVFAVPGSIFSERSAGPHMLLSNGAAPITTSQDILYTLGISPHINEASIVDPELIFNQCSQLEQKILRLLSEPLPRTDLIRKLIQTRAGNMSEISVAISLLEMKKFIDESGGVLRQNIATKNKL
jgi:DNA processing protein